MPSQNFGSPDDRRHQPFGVYDVNENEGTIRFNQLDPLIAPIRAFRKLTDVPESALSPSEFSGVVRKIVADRTPDELVELSRYFQKIAVDIGSNTMSRQFLGLFYQSALLKFSDLTSVGNDLSEIGMTAPFRKDRDQLAVLLLVQGKIRWLTGKNDEAYNLFLKAKDTFTAFDAANNNHAIETKGLLASHLLNQKKFDEARGYAGDLIDALNSILGWPENHPLKVLLRSTVARIYKMQGDQISKGSSSYSGYEANTHYHNAKNHFLHVCGNRPISENPWIRLEAAKLSIEYAEVAIHLKNQTLNIQQLELALCHLLRSPDRWETEKLRLKVAEELLNCYQCTKDILSAEKMRSIIDHIRGKV